MERVIRKLGGDWLSEKQESIYSILKEEHKEVQKLFKQILDSEKFQADIFSQIDQALTMHMQGEEKHFYPRLTDSDETHELTLEAIEEHNAAKQLQSTIASSDSEVQFAKTQVLSEMIEHHVEDEEKELFKAAKKVLSKEDENEIGRLFLEEKASMSKMAPPTVM